MALSKENVKDINEWLLMLDSDLDLVKYAPDFTRLDFINTKTLKFFKPKDFDKFACAPSSLHRRILLHNIEKLKSGSPSLFSYDTPPDKDKHIQHFQGLTQTRLYSYWRWFNRGLKFCIQEVEKLKGNRTNIETLERIGRELQLQESRQGQINNLGRCAALEDGVWYRAWNMSTTSEGKHDVLFIDFGNTAALTDTDVCKAAMHIWAIPPMAKPFRLIDSGRNTKMKEFLNKKITLEIVAPGTQETIWHNMSRVARKNLSQGLDTNGTVQPQKMARDLKFRIKGDGLYYLYSENKGADQLRGSYDKNVYALKFVKFTLIDSQGGFLF